MSTFALLISCLLLSSGARAAELELKNPDFEEAMSGTRIPGWSRTQHAGVRAYEVSTDRDNVAKGNASIRMLRTTEQAYGLISQQLDVPELAGKAVELIAALKSEAVGRKGWVMVLTFKNHNDILDQVRAPVMGDTDWKDVVISKVAPLGANRIDVGFLLLDGGSGWVDNVRLRTVEEVKSGPEVASGKPQATGSDAAQARPLINARDVSKASQKES